MYPLAIKYKLATFVRYCRIENDGIFHRDLAEAEMTGHLWLAMIAEIKDTFEINDISFELMQKVTRVSMANAPKYLEKIACNQC